MSVVFDEFAACLSIPPAALSRAAALDLIERELADSLATAPAPRVLDARTFDFTVHDGIITIENTATGNRRVFKIERQAPFATFAPGERVVSVYAPEARHPWQGFAFASQRGIHLWSKRRTSETEAFARMLENPPRYAAKGYTYSVRLED